MAYFYYQKNIFGRWAPQLSADPPQTRSADGTKRTITQVVELPDSAFEVSLTSLAAMHPLAPMSTILER